MSRRRALATLLVFFSALAAAGLGVFLTPPIPGRATITGFGEAPWLKACLLAYGLGTLLVPFGLADVREPVPRTLRIWAILVAASLLLWLAPLAFAPQFGWTWDGCMATGMGLTLFPGLFADLRNILSPRVKASSSRK